MPATVDDDELDHAVPVEDEREHWASVLCWCDPTIDPDDSSLLIHKCHSFH